MSRIACGRFLVLVVGLVLLASHRTAAEDNPRKCDTKWPHMCLPDVPCVTNIQAGTCVPYLPAGIPQPQWHDWECPVSVVPRVESGKFRCKYDGQQNPMTPGFGAYCMPDYLPPHPDGVARVRQEVCYYIQKCRKGTREYPVPYPGATPVKEVVCLNDGEPVEKLSGVDVLTICILQ